MTLISALLTSSIVFCCCLNRVCVSRRRPPPSSPPSRCARCHGGVQPPRGAVAGYLSLPAAARPGPLLPGVPRVARARPLAGQHPLEATVPGLPRVPAPQLAQPAPPGAAVLERGPEAARRVRPHLDSERAGAPVVRLPPLLPPAEGPPGLARGARVRVRDPARGRRGGGAVRPRGSTPGRV